MGQRIDQFCEDLRLKLTAIDDGVTALKANVQEHNSELVQHVRDRRDALDARIKERHQHIVDANHRAMAWGESRKLETQAQIDAWKQSREIDKLERRAQSAEAYASDIAEIALAAVDEAESAALDAWLARLDADLAAGG
ncbi:hypothetical protein [Devosia sp. FKR38]|uniref:hypothetical protein n=1 Tax=Devosia sp. FKR38 TaxID=2562312 RepID=UPI0010C0AA6D|nr:hypothetical protein [Devosia sp. FKR38]